MLSSTFLTEYQMLRGTFFTLLQTRHLASHLRTSVKRQNGVIMRISETKTTKKQFLEPVIKPGLKSLAPDDPRRFLPVSPMNSNETSLITYDKLLDRFINTLMRQGDKQLTRTLVENALVRIKHTQLRAYRLKSPGEQSDSDLSKVDPLKVLHSAIENCRPVLRLEGIRRGGIMYQVPVPVTENFSYFQSIRWIIESCRERENKGDTRFSEVLAEELIAAGVENTGKSIRKKQELHRKCEQNRAYAHFRW